MQHGHALCDRQAQAADAAAAAPDRRVAQRQPLVQALVQFLNRRYAVDGFNEVKFSDVQKIAGTCVTGCRIVAPGPITSRPAANALFSSMTAVAAHEAA